MAERRMFAKTVIDSDAFLDMPLSTQSLYFHLSMRADDDGFNNNPKKVQRMIGASDDDLKLLILKKFIIPFDNGIIVIKHWKIHNYIQKDRYRETVYQEEKAMLQTNKNKSYTLCIQDGYDLDTQVRIGKESIEIEKEIEIEEGNREKIDYQKIANLYNDICISFPKITKLSDARKKSIKARLNTYTIDDFTQLFTKAQASDFLKGKNNRNWQANFDWLIKDNNMVKVLDGNYDNKGNTQAKTSTMCDEQKKLNDEILRMLGEI